MVRRDTSRKEPWGFALCWFNKENFVAFSKLIFKTLIIQWNHCYNIGDRDKIYIYHLRFSSADTQGHI